MDDPDIAIIGGGPAGVAAALHAAAHNWSCLLVEKRPRLGGTCLNVGCIPSKALLHSSANFEAAGRSFAAQGIRIEPPQLDLAAMMAHKDGIVRKLADGVDLLIKRAKVHKITGSARLGAGGRLHITPANQAALELHPKKIIIATGSEVAALPPLPFDDHKIISSTQALSLPEVPARLLIIGAGAIGLELGSVWQRLGAEVTIIEALPRIVPGIDAEIAQAAQRIFTRQGLHFILNARVIGATTNADGIKVSYQHGGEEKTWAGSCVLVAIGRKPHTQDLGLAEAGITCDGQGFIVTDDGYATSQPHIYAIGDCVAGPMLAHKAEDDGIACIEVLAGAAPLRSYARVPAVVYSEPELASVGASEESLKESKQPYLVGRAHLAANARAQTLNAAQGLVKLLLAQEDRRILGAAILAPAAGELISELVVGMEFAATAEDIARVSHSHPGLSEAIRAAARNVMPAKNPVAQSR